MTARDAYRAALEKPAPEVCAVCNKAGRACRFGARVLCACWYGVPCSRTIAQADELAETGPR
jgi:hypothetical protein